MDLSPSGVSIILLFQMNEVLPSKVQEQHGNSPWKAVEELYEKSLADQEKHFAFPRYFYEALSL